MFTTAFVASSKNRMLLVVEATEETPATVAHEVPILRDNNLSHNQVSEGVKDKTEQALAEVMVAEVVLVSNYQVLVEINHEQTDKYHLLT